MTVAAIVVGRGLDAGRYLMVEEETRDGLRINQPAGHLERGESLVDAVVRETLEETTRRYSPAGLLGIYLSRSIRTNPRTPAEPVTYLRFAFVGIVDEPVEGLRLDEGIVRTMWMTAEELRDSRTRHRSEMVLRCVEDHAGGRTPMPLDLIHTDVTALSID